MKVATAFKLGDRVAWVSQARGTQIEKHGEIVEVVPPGGLPSRERFENLYRSAGVGLPRNHESYVVAVSSVVRLLQRKTITKRRPVHYWPSAFKLGVD